MTGRLPTVIVRPSTGTRLRVRRAWPRSAGEVLLELVDERDRRVAAQWWAAPGRAHKSLVDAGPPAEVSGNTLLLPDGADPTLRPLPALVGRPGAVLVAHRPGRRAVVRHGDGLAFTKVVRPGRITPLLQAIDHARAAAARAYVVPQIRAVDAGAGTVEQTTLPGRTLLAVGADPQVGADALEVAWRTTGAALARLHDGLSASAPAHHAADEAVVTRRWLRLAAAFGRLPAIDVDALLSPLLADPGPTGLLHRDLHDQQLLVAGDLPVGLLDVDTLALGERALDVANVLVHLELRTRQRLLTPTRAGIARSAFLAGLAPDDATLARVPAHAVAARLRLAAVYSFRPRWRSLADGLLADTLASIRSPTRAR